VVIWTVLSWLRKGRVGGHLWRGNIPTYVMVIGSLQGLKLPGRGVDHPPPSIAVVKEREELYIYFPFWAFVACSGVNFILTCTVTGWHWIGTALQSHKLCAHE
jgi:hypothetical protein